MDEREQRHRELDKDFVIKHDSPYTDYTEREFSGHTFEQFRKQVLHTLVKHYSVPDNMRQIVEKLRESQSDMAASYGNLFRKYDKADPEQAIISEAACCAWNIFMDMD